MQIPILQGTYTDTEANYRRSYPRNAVPVPKDNGIAQGYLRIAPGVRRFDVAAPLIDGASRGAIMWEGVHYRVIGSKLVSVSGNGAVTILGDVTTDGRQVALDYSFDNLAIGSAGRLYYWDGSLLTQVTDPDLGLVVDMIWMEGYFISTDGTFVPVSELTDPYVWDPLKYGATDSPDKTVGLMDYRRELYVFNRYNIYVYDNQPVDGATFPFVLNPGATINKGALSRSTKCQIDQRFAFVGGGQNEPISIYFGNGGVADKVATQDIEEILAQYPEEILAQSLLESRADKVHQFLYLHLPDQTMVYDLSASMVTGVPVWYFLSSAADSNGAYRPINFLYANNEWTCGDTVDSRLGVIDPAIVTHYDIVVGWQFDTTLLYNEARGAIVNSLELIGLTGRVEIGDEPTISLSWSDDGLTYSDEKFISLGRQGETTKRLQWRNIGEFEQTRAFRFKGRTRSLGAFTRLEAEIEPLAN